MAFIDKVLRKSQKSEVDIEEVLNSLDVTEEQTQEDADAYVKPIYLKSSTDLKSIAKELKEGNLVILNVGDISKRSPVVLKEKIGKLKRFIEDIDGDIARISEHQVLLTPTRIKIIKKK